MCVDPAVSDNVLQNALPSVLPDESRKYFVKGGLAGPGWHARKKETVQLKEFKEGLLQHSPDVLLLIPTLLASQSEKIKLGMLKLYVDTLVPKEIVQQIWQVSLKGDLQGLSQHTQEYGEFLTWKAQRQLEAQGVVDIIPNSGDDEPKALS